jgi:hypothetical protein
MNERNGQCQAMRLGVWFDLFTSSSFIALTSFHRLETLIWISLQMETETAAQSLTDIKLHTLGTREEVRKSFDRDMRGQRRHQQEAIDTYDRGECLLCFGSDCGRSLNQLRKQLLIVDTNPPKTKTEEENVVKADIKEPKAIVNSIVVRLVEKQQNSETHCALSWFFSF